MLQEKVVLVDVDFRGLIISHLCSLLLQAQGKIQQSTELPYFNTLSKKKK